ncbi:hypothetical protein EDD18DRAFT_1107358 [Armillaria luteobubalina]|uniref:Uncharacterized protein n=1 Tax=Armillaria luteobubalina TaxID=153913 RepID=A0AA39Q3U9_9AGAR|nr:hypothetical protein EDD18DRAFT_1107358 [Armillaria luteobubalina]
MTWEMPCLFCLKWHPLVNQSLLQTISVQSIIPTAVDNLDSIKLKNFKHKQDQEWILELAINQGNIDALLTMMIKQGGQFESSTFTVPLQGQSYEFTVYHRDLWSWTLDILQDPLLTPYLNWDAQQLFKVNGSTSQRFYMEPHTGNMFWEIQVQGYPVIVRLGNLPSHIHNGQGVRGGHVIGWLPIVKEEAQHTGKSYYTDFKRAIWHKAFEFILSPIKEKSRFGAWITKSNHLLKEIKKRMIKLGSSYTQLADELLQAFPSWKDLYHFKQGFMNVTFTDGRKYEALSKLIFIAHAIFMAANDPIGYILLRALHVYMELDIYASLTLHTSDTLQDGQARTPIFASVIEEYKKATQNEYKAMQQTLTHTDTIPKEKKLKCWNFLKAHSHQHLFDDIEAKGIMLNYNTKPNESMHGSFKELYQHHTNFKNVDEQEGDEDDKGETGDSNKDKLAPTSSTSSKADYAATASLHGGHGKGGGKLSIAEVKAKAVDDSDFHDFLNHLSSHMKKHFESHPEELPSDNGVPAEFDSFKCQDQILLYGMIKVNYSSVVDWSFTTDILRCSPSFNYHPHYDFVLLDTNQGPMFVQLVLIFKCVVHEKVYPLMLVQPFKEAIGPITKKDHDLGFYRVRTRMKGDPLIVSIYSIIRGALLIEDIVMNRTNNRGERMTKDYLVVDMIDADMFLQMQNLSYVGRATRTTRR